MHMWGCFYLVVCFGFRVVVVVPPEIMNYELLYFPSRTDGLLGAWCRLRPNPQQLLWLSAAASLSPPSSGRPRHSGRHRASGRHRRGRQRGRASGTVDVVVRL
jgi:hypothetical protein